MYICNKRHLFPNGGSIFFVKELIKKGVLGTPLFTRARVQLAQPEDLSFIKLEVQSDGVDTSSRRNERASRNIGSWRKAARARGW